MGRKERGRRGVVNLVIGNKVLIENSDFES
jgi:hypothetical protein